MSAQQVTPSLKFLSPASHAFLIFKVQDDRNVEERERHACLLQVLPQQVRVVWVWAYGCTCTCTYGRSLHARTTACIVIMAHEWRR